MSPYGLDPRYYEETCGAIITGWVWAKYYILKNPNFSSIPIIFYSAFMSELLFNEEFQIMRKQKNIRLLPKENINDLIDELRKIINEG